MSIVINRRQLANILAVLGTVVPKRSSSPAMQCVLFEVNGTNAKLTGTNGEVRVSCGIVVPESKLAEFCVNAERFSQIVAQGDSDTVTLDLDNHTLKIRDASGVFSIPTQPRGDFPPGFVHADDKHKTYRLSAHDTAHGIASVRACIANEMSRYAISGILFDIFNNTATYVATDGRRLATCSGEATIVSGDGRTGAIVPALAAMLVERLAKAADVEAGVDAEFRDNSAKFSASTPHGHVTIQTLLVEGKFPPYKDVVPKDEPAGVVTLDHRALRSALARASIMTNEESRGVAFDFKPGELTLSGHAPENGDATIRVPITSESGKPCGVMLNPDFVVQWLNAQGGDGHGVTMALRGATKPVVYTAQGGGELVVMPMNRA